MVCIWLELCYLSIHMFSYSAHFFLLFKLLMLGALICIEMSTCVQYQWLTEINRNQHTYVATNWIVLYVFLFWFFLYYSYYSYSYSSLSPFLDHCPNEGIIEQISNKVTLNVSTISDRLLILCRCIHFWYFVDGKHTKMMMR